MTTPSQPRKSPRPTPPIDPLLQQRLAQLGNRRPGSPLPPPKAGPAAKAPTKTGRRAKPARAAKLSALALSAVTTLGLTVVFADQNGQTDSVQLTSGTAAGSLVTVAAAAPATTAVDAPATTATVAATVATTAPPAPAAVGVVDGTYVGGSDTNRWGTVQVQVVYTGGQITDVQILQYPNGDRNSVRISQAALPRLITEALQSQSADVNTVSGATYTSKSYRISLQSAVDAANAASGISG